MCSTQNLDFDMDKKLIDLLQATLEALEYLHDTGDTQVFDMYDAPVLIPAIRDTLQQLKEAQLSCQTLTHG